MRIIKVENGYQAIQELPSGVTLAIVDVTPLRAMMWVLWGVKKEVRAMRRTEGFKPISVHIEPLKELVKA